MKLFQQFEEDIYRMAYVYVRNENDALDVVQEVAYQSFKNISSLRKPEFIKTWLLKITIRCSIDIINKNKKVIHLNPELQQRIPDIEIDLPGAITLRDIIAKLNHDEKSIILLKYVEGYSFQEIAEIANLPLGTAKSILYRALGKLRKEWKGADTYE